MEYRLVVLQHPTEEEVVIKILDNHPLTKHQVSEYVRASEVIREVSHGGLLFYARQALSNYRVFIEAVDAAIDETGEVDTNHAYRATWELAGSCSALTFAAAVHLFQEQTEAAAGRASGEAAQRQVHETFRKAYEREPAHYAAYRLRNLLVHYSMRCVALDVNPSPLPGRRRPSMRVDLDVAFQAKSGFNTRVRDYLSASSSRVDLDELFVSALRSMSDVFEDTLDLTHPSANDDFELISELGKLFEPFEGTRALGELPVGYPHDEDRATFNVLTRDVFVFAEGRMRGERPPDSLLTSGLPGPTT